MKKFLALVRARNLEFYRDRTALVWSLLFPFIVLAGFTYGYAGKSEPLLRATVYGPLAAENAALIAFKGTPGLETTVATDLAVAQRKLSRFETDIVVSLEDHSDQIVSYVNHDSDKGRLAETLLAQAVAGSPSPHPVFTQKEVTGKKIRYVDWLLPGLLAMNIMFGSMFGVGYTIVRYRKNGVLKRLRATPLSAFQFLSAQILSRMFIMLFTSLIVIVGSIFLVGFAAPPNVGSWIDLLIFLGVSSSAMIAVGLVIAARITSEEVADGVLNLLTWPMIFLSGIWFSLDGASPWVMTLSRFMPLSHVVAGLRKLMIDGDGLGAVLPEIAILAIITVVLTSVGAAIFRWR